MRKLILFILIFLSIGYANSKKYYIQLGSFKQLRLLEHNIENLPPQLRSHIVIVNSNGWYIPFAYYTTKLMALRRQLPIYKRYFPDAHISSSSYILNHQIVRNYTKNVRRRYTRPTRRYPQTVIKEPQVVTYNSYVPTVEYERIIPQREEIVIPKRRRIVKTPQQYQYFTKRMLSGNHYYLAYKATKDNPDLLVKINFLNHKVIYQPIIGDMNLREAKYLVHDKKLYMFADDFSKDGAYSKIEKNRKDYILVSSWYGGKKLNTLRYYYNLKDAKKYLKKEESGDLATALEDGEFNRLQQAFEGVKGVYIGVDESY